MKYKVAFETLGCRLNQAETANLHRSFLDKGYVIEGDVASADLCIINTCALTAQAVAKCRRKINAIMRRNPDVCIAVVGCYAQTETEVLRDIEGIDYIVGTADKLNLADIIPEPAKLMDAVVLTGRSHRKDFKIPGAGYYPLHTRANLKIQEGCDFVCSFCVIPKSRGPARSRDFDDIIREARVLTSQGHREIVLTGVNLGTYQHHRGGLGELISELAGIESLDRIRLSSIEPTTISSGLFDLMQEGGKLCPYLHVSLQSGDDRVLKSMRRRYTAAEYKDFIDLFLKRVPGAGIGTDVLVGFPGEDDKAFERTCTFVASIPFTNIHVFSFSARRGTAAYLMEEKISAGVIKARSLRMHALARRKRFEYYHNLEGKKLEVLFEEKNAEGYWVGFSPNYVKVGVMNRDDLRNKMGLVEVKAVIHKEPLGNPMAEGDLVCVESETAGSGAN